MFFKLNQLVVRSCLKYALYSSLCLPSNNNFKSPCHQTLHLFLEGCSTIKELKQLHAQIMLHGFFNQNLTAGKLVSFCAVSKNGDLLYAQLIFDHIREPNRFMYNSLIRGYASSSDPMKSFLLFRRMIRTAISPNEFTLPFVLKACASTLKYMEAMLLRSQAIKLGIDSQVCFQNALINVFVVCGLIELGRKVFDEIPDRTLVSWNSMIGGYSKMDCSAEALLLFQEMRALGLVPDEFTFVNLLSVCTRKCDLDLGRLVHSYMEVYGTNTDLYLLNSLIDMYAKCGNLHSAQTIFNRITHKNVVSWTSMVSAYAKNGLLEFAEKTFKEMPIKNVVSWNLMMSCYIENDEFREALNLFYALCKSAVVPDEATLVNVLSACSQLGDLIEGKKTHSYICSNNVLPSITLYNSIMDMYAKCGPIETALEIFFEIENKNLVSWNIIIGAHALHGRGIEAVNLFEKMQIDDGIKPDKITFTGLLSACSHSGLIEKGRCYFDQIYSTYRISHDIEHYACMVDMFGRGGLLNEAVKIIVEMPMRPDSVIWGALLGACKIHGDTEIARQVIKQVLELEPYSSGVYVLISNMYYEAQKREDVKKIRKIMNCHGIKKGRAVSSIQSDGCGYEFMVDDKRHERSSEIYCMLDQLTDHLKSVGYYCSTQSAFFDIEEI